MSHFLLMSSKRARVSTKTTPKKYSKSSSKKSLTMYKQPTNPIRFVKRTCDYFSINVSGVAGSFGAFNFTLANVPGNAEFTALYDQYKISAVSVCFYPRQTETSSLATVDTAKGNARLLTAIDYNDDTAPLTFDALREYENCEVVSILEKHERYIPKPLFLNNSGQNVNAWIATSSPSTRHYGLKYAVEPTLATGNSFTYTVEVMYYLAFKNVK